MVEEQPLRAAQAARRLGIPTKELLRLVYERRIRYVMVDGIAHVADRCRRGVPLQSLVNLHR